MNAQLRAIAHKCLEGAESNTMAFPHIVSTLMDAGFEGYLMDFRRGMVAYYLPTGDAGYLVSFLGRCVLYFGRSAETHVEHFPGTK